MQYAKQTNVLEQFAKELKETTKEDEDDLYQSDKDIVD